MLTIHGRSRVFFGWIHKHVVLSIEVTTPIENKHAKKGQAIYKKKISVHTVCTNQMISCRCDTMRYFEGIEKKKLY